MIQDVRLGAVVVGRWWNGSTSSKREKPPTTDVFLSSMMVPCCITSARWGFHGLLAPHPSRAVRPRLGSVSLEIKQFNDDDDEQPSKVKGTERSEWWKCEKLVDDPCNNCSSSRFDWAWCVCPWMGGQSKLRNCPLRWDRKNANYSEMFLGKSPYSWRGERNDCSARPCWEYLGSIPGQSRINS